jgi:hypothetical protein
MICHNYRICHKNRICMHAPVRVDVVQWLGVVFMLCLWTIYAISMNYLRHLFKKITEIMACIRRGVVCRTGGLTGAEKVWPGAWRGHTRPHAPGCWVRYMGWLWFSVTIESPGSQYTDTIYNKRMKIIIESGYFIGVYLIVLYAFENIAMELLIKNGLRTYM